MSLYYRREDISYPITTYSTLDELNEYQVDQSHRLNVREGGITKYVPLSTNISHPLASHMRARVADTDYAVLNNASSPIYWSRASNYTDLVTPTVYGEVGSASISGNPIDYPTGIYGTCARGNGGYIPYPGFGYVTMWKGVVTPNNINPYLGTVSFWGMVVSDQGSYQGGSVFFGGNKTEYIHKTKSDGYHIISPGNVGGWGVGIACHRSSVCRLYLLFDSAVIGYVDIGRSTWYHISIVWDSAKSLTGGSSIVVYLNRVARLSTTANLPITTLQFSLTYGNYTNYLSYSHLDNPKVWRTPRENRVLSDYASETWL